MFIDDVRVIVEKGPLSAEDAKYYIDRIRRSTKLTLKKVAFRRGDAYLDIRYSFEENPLERIRRVDLAPEVSKKAASR